MSASAMSEIIRGLFASGIVLRVFWAINVVLKSKKIVEHNIWGWCYAFFASKKAELEF